jgi:hypothetical protein
MRNLSSQGQQGMVSLLLHLQEMGQSSRNVQDVEAGVEDLYRPGTTVITAQGNDNLALISSFTIKASIMP